MNTKTAISIGVVVVVVVAALLILKNVENKPGEHDALAACIKDSGAIFYGAFWCPHCREQKEMFGKSAELLPYTECSNPDSSQNNLCTEKQIQSYPTWEFPDGVRLTGVQEFVALAAKTNCTEFLTNDESSETSDDTGGTSEAS